MTVLLLLPNPDRIRLALRAHRVPGLLRYQQSVVTNADSSKPEPEAKSDAVPLAIIPEPSSRRTPAETPASKPAPVRVASADPSATLGLPPVASPLPAAPALTPASAPVPENAALSIPVPDPVVRQPAPMPELLVPAAQPDPPVAAKSAAPVKPAEPVEIQPLAPAAETSEQQALKAYLHSQGIEIETGERPGRWNFRFEESPLPLALRALGSQAGWTVVVAPEVAGVYSGRFENSDPAQAFAVIVKMHNCSVSRRGNMLLVGLRTTAAQR
jgi:hypothetical protein